MRKQLFLRLFMLLLSTVIFVACGTPIEIKSEPTGADVYHEGQLVGQTPLIIKASPWGTETSVKLEKEGYNPNLQIINAKYNGWTGSWAYPNLQFYRLTKKKD